MRIEIICTGDEVLSGKTVNTNYSHMARRLQEVGLDVYWGTTVGDDRDSLVEAFKHAAARADAVIVNKFPVITLFGNEHVHHRQSDGCIRTDLRCQPQIGEFSNGRLFRVDRHEARASLFGVFQRKVSL